MKVKMLFLSQSDSGLGFLFLCMFVFLGVRIVYIHTYICIKYKMHTYICMWAKALFHKIRYNIMNWSEYFVLCV